MAFCASGVFGKSNSIIYYVDKSWAIKSYSAGGQKKDIREAETGASGAVIGCDYDSGTVFVLFTKSDSSTLVLVDAETGKIASTLTGVEIKDATAAAGSKSKNLLYVASGKGDALKVTPYKISGGSFAISGSSLDLANDGSFKAIKKEGIDYKITDMAAINGSLYALFASCFVFKKDIDIWDGENSWSFPCGSYSTAGGVLKLVDGDSLAVDTNFAENGVAGYSKNVDGGYDAGGAFVYYYLFNGSLEDAKSNLEFNNPQKIIAVKPDELVIAENGLCRGKNSCNNLARSLAMELNGKIKSVTSVHGKSFSYGGNSGNDGLTIFSASGALFE